MAGASSLALRKPSVIPGFGLTLGFVLAYLGLIVLIPLAALVLKTAGLGWTGFFRIASDPRTVHALWLSFSLSLQAAAINAVFGLIIAWVMVRYRFPGRRVLDAIIDLPIAVSPVVVGLALILVYGRNTTVGGWLGDHGLPIIFSVPGMVIATMFVALPLVIRAVAPVLEEIGDEQEQAAATLGASAFQRFTRITLPSIRGALAYGVVLALARSLGEYGAVAVVSGRVVGKTQTVTLLVEQQYRNFDKTGAYASAMALVVVAVISLIISRFLRPRGGTR
jgi:sulfate transport system permease protein